MKRRQTPQDTPSVWPDAAWWHGFGSAQLDDLIAEAESSNDDLAGAIARVQEADAQVRIAGAPLFPTLDFGADATRERAPVTGEGPHPFNVFNPQLTASYELDFWGKNRATRDAARAAALASRFDRQTVALTVVSSVATTYFQALEFRDRLDIARKNRRTPPHTSCNGLQLEQSGRHRHRDWTWHSRPPPWPLLYAAIPPLQQQLRQSGRTRWPFCWGKTPESVDVANGSVGRPVAPAAGCAGPALGIAGAPSGCSRGRGSS